nr:RNA-dependent RNA polymerase [Mercurialis partitivirus 1]
MKRYRNTLVGYTYTDFLGDLEKTNQHHHNVVRREVATTYTDDYALQAVIDLDSRQYEQFLAGWSRSYYTPEKHQEAIMQYAYPNTPVQRINREIYNQAIDVVKNEFRSLPDVRAHDVLTQLDIVKYKSSSAAGYGYIGTKGEPYGLNHDRAITRAKAVLWSGILEDGEGIEHVIKTQVPDIGYTRTQLTDLSEKTKVRQVWGRAFHYILLEGLVADPFIQAVMSSNTFIHAGRDPTASVPELLSHIAETCDWIYSLDWKQFDATVSRFEIQSAFDIIKSKTIFPNRETEEAFEITRQLFIHKKVAAPDGNIYFAHKGIPSGSYYTSLVGSIVNRLRIEYLYRSIEGRGPKICHTLGDDSLVGDDSLIVPTRFASIANEIGWFFNPNKTEYSRVPEEVTFLGRSYRGGLNVRDLKRCLRLLVYPEYPVLNGRISAYRAKSIAEDCGSISNLLNRIASRLERHFGVASEDEVPTYFKRYLPFM